MSTARHKKSEPLVPFWGSLDQLKKTKFLKHKVTIIYNEQRTDHVTKTKLCQTFDAKLIKFKKFSEFRSQSN